MVSELDIDAVFLRKAQWSSQMSRAGRIEWLNLGRMATRALARGLRGLPA